MKTALITLAALAVIAFLCVRLPELRLASAAAGFGLLCLALVWLSVEDDPKPPKPGFP